MTNSEHDYYDAFGVNTKNSFNTPPREMNTNQMILNIGFDAGDNWQERLADALLAIQAHVRESEKLRIADTLDGNDFTAQYTLFGELK